MQNDDEDDGYYDVDDDDDNETKQTVHQFQCWCLVRLSSNRPLSYQNTSLI